METITVLKQQVSAHWMCILLQVHRLYSKMSIKDIS